jgi:hypothetical protein
MTSSGICRPVVLVDCFHPEDGGDTFPPKTRLLQESHVDTSHMTIFFCALLFNKIIADYREGNLK